MASFDEEFDKECWYLNVLKVVFSHKNVVFLVLSNKQIYYMLASLLILFTNNIVFLQKCLTPKNTPKHERFLLLSKLFAHY